MNEKLLYHIGLPLSMRGEARWALLPGDPGRCEKIARCLEQPAFVASSREFTTWRGMLDGETVLVTSTGIGGPSASIAMWELAQLGVENFIRVGTCGGMQTEVLPGDLILPTGAIRMEGTSREFLPAEYPAVPDFSLLRALAKCAGQSGRRWHAGPVQSKDSFYGQHSPERMPVAERLTQNWKAYCRAGALASEMECAALFCCAAALGVRAAAVLLCVWNQERERAGLDSADIPDTEEAIHTAVEAMRMCMGSGM